MAWDDLVDSPAPCALLLPPVLWRAPCDGLPLRSPGRGNQAWSRKARPGPARPGPDLQTGRRLVLAPLLLVTCPSRDDCTTHAAGSSVCFRSFQCASGSSDVLPVIPMRFRFVSCASVQECQCAWRRGMRETRAHRRAGAPSSFGRHVPGARAASLRGASRQARRRVGTVCARPPGGDAGRSARPVGTEPRGE